MNKVGTIYKNIANACLTAWRSDVSEAKRRELLARGDLGEIESYIGAKSSIDTAIEAVREGLEEYQIYLPDDFSSIVYYSSTPNGDIEEFTLEIGRNHAIDADARISIAIHALAKIHERWIADNKKKFFDEKRRGKRFMFLPIQYIGWDEVLKDFIFLEPILQIICIRPETYIIQQAYTTDQVVHISKLSEGRENAAIWEIRESLLRLDQNISDEEVEEVTKQAVSRCPAFKAK